MEITRITLNAIKVIKGDVVEEFPEMVLYEDSFYMYGAHTNHTETAAVYYSPAWLYGEEANMRWLKDKWIKFLAWIEEATKGGK
jgi:hypothetical protein